MDTTDAGPDPQYGLDPDAARDLMRSLETLADYDPMAHRRPIPEVEERVRAQLEAERQAKGQLGGAPSDAVVFDESKAYAEQVAAAAHEQRQRRAVAEFEASGAKIQRRNGYLRGGKRRKRELKALRGLFEPTLRERRETTRAARNRARR